RRVALLPQASRPASYPWLRRARRRRSGRAEELHRAVERVKVPFCEPSSSGRIDEREAIGITQGDEKDSSAQVKRIVQPAAARIEQHGRAIASIDAEE